MSLPTPDQISELHAEDKSFSQVLQKQVFQLLICSVVQGKQLHLISIGQIKSNHFKHGKFENSMEPIRKRMNSLEIAMEPIRKRMNSLEIVLSCGWRYVSTLRRGEGRQASPSVGMGMFEKKGKAASFIVLVPTCEEHEYKWIRDRKIEPLHDVLNCFYWSLMPLCTKPIEGYYTTIWWTAKW